MVVDSGVIAAALRDADQLVFAGHTPCTADQQVLVLGALWWQGPESVKYFGR
ncbi:MAG: hypothetical protein U1E57_04025 [Paenacidovorax caeni]